MNKSIIPRVCVKCHKNNIVDKVVFYTYSKPKELRGNDFCIECYKTVKDDFQKNKNN